MNKDNAKDFLPLVQAMADGKTIQFKSDEGWVDMSSPDFSCDPCDYRIKPEPREFWVIPTDNVSSGVAACHIVGGTTPSWAHLKETIRVREIID